MTKINTVFLDLGSTLIYFDREDETPTLRANRALRDHLAAAGMALMPDFEMAYQVYKSGRFAWRDRYAVETPAPMLLHDALVNMGYPDPGAELLRSALDAYYGALQPSWQVEEDALPMLNALREAGMKVGIVSNAGYQADVDILVKQAGLDADLDLLLTSAECGYRKPQRRIFEIALERIGSSAAESVMVGDLLETDILGARKSGLRSIWITRRANPHVPKAERERRVAEIRADAVVASLAEIPPIIEQWNCRS